MFVDSSTLHIICDSLADAPWESHISIAFRDMFETRREGEANNSRGERGARVSSVEGQPLFHLQSQTNMPSSANARRRKVSTEWQRAYAQVHMEAIQNFQ